MRTIRISFYLFFLVIHAYGQVKPSVKEAALEFSKLKESESKYPAISMEITYKIFAGHNSTVLSESFKGKFCKKDKFFQYQELYGTTTVKTKELIMVKDDSNQVVLLAPAPQEPLKNMDVDLEKLLSLCSEVSSLTCSSNEKAYKLSFGNPSLELSAVDVYFNTSTYLINKIVLYYNREFDFNPNDGKDVLTKARVEMNFENINTSPEFPTSQFSFSSVLNKSNGKWKLASGYHNYSLIDQTLISIK